MLAGSFDPLHDGHEGLAAAAARLLGQPVTFELSMTNVDKPVLSLAEVQRRLGQFAGRYDIVVTRATRFSEKARLFPGCAFVIGWDTAVRLVAPRYYEGDVSRMVRALEEIRGLGCRFMVAGRSSGRPVPRGHRNRGAGGVRVDVHVYTGIGVQAGRVVHRYPRRGGAV